MSRLVLTKELLARLRAELLQGDKESCAVLFGRSVEISGRLARIVVRECVQPPATAYQLRTQTRAQLHPEFVAGITRRARDSGESLIFVHTHPFPLNTFSEIDDAGEAELAAFLRRRVPQSRHAAMLLTPEVSIARELGKETPLRVYGVGGEIVWGGQESAKEPDAVYDRQIRAFGRQGQKVLETIRVGIVGLGGTGSVVLQQLAHLGIQDFVLVDPDTIEDTNLNRVVGAAASDVGRPKVEATKAWATQINPGIRIEARQESVLRASVARSLTETDVVFCCTDSHGSRAVLNQLAYQYLLPIIDMGVVIALHESRITNIAGRVQLLAPGLACMVCGNLLDAEQIRRDLLTDFERQADPYITGHPEPAPAVISLNSTVASLATTMFLNTVLGIPGSARFINYDGIAGICRPAYCDPHPVCVVCSPSGAFARCDEWPLPGRLD